MPLKDFKCEKCGFKTEELVRTGQDTYACPECGYTMKALKVPSRTTFVLRGSCWARDGYKK